MPNRRDVFLALQAAHQLPTPSPAAREVIRLCRCESISVDEIAHAVQADPTLSAELLKYANSAALASGIQIASVQRAIVKLGISAVSHLALCLSVASANRHGSCHAFNYRQFWSLSLARGIAGKILATSIASFDPDEIFSCAMLSHMGELVLATIFPDEYDQILNGGTNDDTRRTMERMRFEIDSAELTAELFLDWGMPASFALAAGFHEETDLSELGESTTRETAELLHLSCRIAALCNGLTPTSSWFSITESLAGKVLPDASEFPGIFDTIAEQWQSWGSLFAISTLAVPGYRDIKTACLDTPCDR